jgi:hypothetical protein
MDQKPSVSRVVHYVAYGTPGGEFPAGICRAAIVTEVYTPTSMPVAIPIALPAAAVNDPELLQQELEKFVGLCVLNPTGLFFNRAIKFDPDKAPGTWHWPERV